MLGAALLLGSAGALAQQPPQLYRWVDKDGHVHYGDSAQSPGARPVNPKLLNSGEDDAAGADERKATAEKQADCKRRADEYVRYRDAAGFTETDALGNSRSYTSEEMDKLRAHKRQDLIDHCGAAALPPDAPAAAAPAAPQS
ncbi:MAG TPA: DUF4124 domain-containing protein [Nevskia sp.]|nr:DUF4124 domain-containing protein [Nevskia sp.]